MKRTMFSKVCAVALGAGIALSLAIPVVAQEKKEKKKPSDRVVRVIMGFAFAGIPEQAPNSKGKIVKIDRSDPKKFLIPFEDARRIIRISSLSARANLCGLKKLADQHFLKLMKAEKALGKWTPYQKTYIQVLHATTSNFMTGSKSSGEDAKKNDDGSSDVKNTYKCPPDQRDEVRAAIEADIVELAKMIQ